MEIILRAKKRDRVFFLSIISALFVGMFWIIIDAGINQGDLFSRDSLILLGLWAFIFTGVVASALCQKIQLTNSELIYRNEYFISRRVKIADIKSANVTYGEKMQRHLSVSAADNSIVIPLGIWSEDAFIKLFAELKKRNPSIDFDDRYDSALNAFGKANYEIERKKVGKLHNKDVGKWALWTLIGVFMPIALLVIGTLLGVM